MFAVLQKCFASRNSVLGMVFFGCLSLGIGQETPQAEVSGTAEMQLRQNLLSNSPWEERLSAFQGYLGGHEAVAAPAVEANVSATERLDTLKEAASGNPSLQTKLEELSEQIAAVQEGIKGGSEASISLGGDGQTSEESAHNDGEDQSADPADLPGNDVRARLVEFSQLLSDLQEATTPGEKSEILERWRSGQTANQAGH